MKIRVLMGSVVAVAVMGVGALVGSVAGGSYASAQTNSATPAPTAVAPGTGSTTPATTPTTGDNRPADGVHGRGGGMRGGHGDRAFGGNLTADGATQAISSTTTTITNVKSDLAYANGKMDTADVQRWINGADTLLKSAQGALASSQYGQAVAYANAARELARTADEQMALKLGAANLPSASQNTGRGLRSDQSTATLTQAQASLILSRTYNHLVEEAAQIKSASNAAEATPYLTDAQNAYKAAYDAYQAGKYSDAANSAKLAEKLAGVAESIAKASTAPANSDTPVTVPAPNF